ncbi:MAG: YhfC family glutamic-type intramembrane protease [Anaerolineae bacterium]
MSIAVIVAFVVALLVELALPFAAGFWVEAKLDVPWRAFWYGALVYGLAQLAVRIPLLSLLGPEMAPADADGFTLILAWAVILAGSTALVELAGRYLGYRFLFRDLKCTWETAIMFGLGMATLESLFLVGLPTLLTFANALSLPGMDPVAMGLDAAQTEQLRLAQAELANLSVWVPLSAAVERLFAMLLQVALAVLVLQAFTARAPDRRPSRRWLWYSLALQFGVGMAVSIASTYGSVLLAEVLLAVASVAAGYWALRLRPAPVLRARVRS